MIKDGVSKSKIIKRIFQAKITFNKTRRLSPRELLAYTPGKIF